MPSDHKSQSERDWAYAKRTLARGDNPEVVIQRIADYRGDEKHGNYGRLTVEKAQLELQRASSLQPPRETFSGLADEADRHQ